MKQIVSIHLGSATEDRTFTATLLGQAVAVTRCGANRDLARVRELIRQYDGKVDAIALEGMALWLTLGSQRVLHSDAPELLASAGMTSIVDGGGVRDALTRWAIRQADRARPGIFNFKRVFLVSALNQAGLLQALEGYTQDIRLGDPAIHLGLPRTLPAPRWLDLFARLGLSRLRRQPYDVLWPPPAGQAAPRAQADFHWADVIAGDYSLIHRFAPPGLRGKVILAETVTDDDLATLRARGVETVILTMPRLGDAAPRASAALVEGVLAALRPDPAQALSPNVYLNLLADLEWEPEIVHLRDPHDEINRFAFVIHPLAVDHIFKHPMLQPLRFLPKRLVEWGAAQIKPIYISRITGAVSPATGQKVEGYLLSLGATPGELMRRPPSFTYRRLIVAARMAERLGAKIMGLGAFTSVVGDAGITVAQKANIAITSGNSLTVAATLEAAKQAVLKMGGRIDQGKAVVIGATGSIGAVCARLLAQAIYDVTLVAPRPERLIELKRIIEAETPNARITIATTPDDFVGDADLIVTTTSALTGKVLDVNRLKPGAVVCDVARPPDVREEDAAQRPDVLVIESGEIHIPGDVDFGFDIGLPPKTAYACLAETTLLAMEGRFEDYTLGRNIEIERVKEIYRLFKKHGFELAGLRSFGRYITDEDIVRKRALADQLRQKMPKSQIPNLKSQ